MFFMSCTVHTYVHVCRYHLVPVTGYVLWRVHWYGCLVTVGLSLWPTSSYSSRQTHRRNISTYVALIHVIIMLLCTVWLQLSLHIILVNFVIWILITKISKLWVWVLCSIRSNHKAFKQRPMAMDGALYFSGPYGWCTVLQCLRIPSYNAYMNNLGEPFFVKHGINIFTL